MDSRSVTVEVTSAAASASSAHQHAAALQRATCCSSRRRMPYFDYDKSDIRGDARDALTHDAASAEADLPAGPQFLVVVEGHCDERGSAEYNLALGDRRATAAKDFLVQLGVPADR